MGSLAEYVHCDASEMTALSTAMAPTYAAVLRRAFGQEVHSKDTWVGNLGCTVSSHPFLEFVMSYSN